jgi:hypothetical protein
VKNVGGIDMLIYYINICCVQNRLEQRKRIYFMVHIFLIQKHVFVIYYCQKITSGFIDGTEISNQMSMYQLFKGSTPWSVLPTE